MHTCIHVHISRHLCFWISGVRGSSQDQTLHTHKLSYMHTYTCTQLHAYIYIYIYIYICVFQAFVFLDMRGEGFVTRSDIAHALYMLQIFDVDVYDIPITRCVWLCVCVCVSVCVCACVCMCVCDESIQFWCGRYSY
jgi:hypothetical protein